MKYLRNTIYLVLIIFITSPIISIDFDPATRYVFEPAMFSYLQTGVIDMPSSRIDAYDWFAEGGELFVGGQLRTKKLIKPPVDPKLMEKRMEKGDILFLGDFNGINGCAVLIDSATLVNNDRVSVGTIGIMKEGKFVYEKMTLTYKYIPKYKKKMWKSSSTQYVVLGWGQFHEKK